MPGCRFSRLELNLFKTYSATQKLNLKNVDLEIVRLQDFTYAEHLMEFDASHNKLIEIPTMLFVNAPEITKVDLSFNEISRIDPMAFEHSSADHSSKLSILDLSNNKITSIDNRTFAALPALTTLYLSSNLIQVIDTGVFAQNKDLNLLQLPYNELTTFACQYFENVKILDLMGNRLTSFDGDCMSGKSEGSYLDLNIENNQLTIITLNSNWTHLRAFSNELEWITIESNLDVLETFNVSQNKIENVPQIFNRLGKALKFLDVTNNFVGKLNVSTFMKMENLEKLVLRNTSLSNIQYGTFHYQKHLKLLDISFNNFKTLKFNAFARDLRQLESLFLDGNDLTEVDGLTTVKFPKVTLLGITKNNFTCEYLSDFMRDWIDVTFVSDALLNGNHIEKVACYEGTEVQYNTQFHDYVTQKWRIESVTTKNQPATKLIEDVENGSTNRVLLVLVLVVLCTICVVVVTKNVILIWRSLRFRDEVNVTYCNEKRYDHGLAENSVEIIRTDLLTSD
ncbi:chaoptin-like [Bradysia coprophila]|uniref:chaoptin-like n=1 Tax=Bradysia coprophila TaxID=38358 RepID=UPI00187DA1D6|nr:chaoptin-like [Bradysia coprophila]